MSALKLAESKRVVSVRIIEAVIASRNGGLLSAYNLKLKLKQWIVPEDIQFTNLADLLKNDLPEETAD